MKILTICFLFILFDSNAFSLPVGDEDHLISDQNGDTVAMVNLSAIYPDEMCEIMNKVITVAGVQFDNSSSFLNSFMFIDAQGHQWSLLTNIRKANFQLSV